MGINVDRQFALAPHIVEHVFKGREDELLIQPQTTGDALQEFSRQRRIGAVVFAFVSVQTRIEPDRLAVLAPEAVQAPARQLLSGIPLALAEVHQAVGGVFFAQAVEQFGGVEALGRAEGGGGPRGGQGGPGGDRNGGQAQGGGDRVRMMGADVKEAVVWKQAFNGTNGVLTVEYTPGSTAVKASKSEQNVWGLLKNMHKGSGMSWIWVLFIDTLAGGLIAMSLTGALLWSRLHGPRLAAVGIVAASLGLAIFAAWPGFV